MKTDLRAGACKSFPSESHPGRYWATIYTGCDFRCDCPGFVYTGACWHVRRRQREERKR